MLIEDASVAAMNTSDHIPVIPVTAVYLDLNIGKRCSNPPLKRRTRMNWCKGNVNKYSEVQNLLSVTNMMVGSPLSIESLMSTATQSLNIAAGKHIPATRVGQTNMRVASSEVIELHKATRCLLKKCTQLQI